MVVYIKDIHDFSTLGVYPVADYELHTSINDEVSSIVVDTKGLKPIEKGNIMLMDGNSYIGIIQSVETDNNKCTLNCVQIINIFNKECWAWWIDQMGFTNYIEAIFDLTWTMLFDDDSDAFYNRQSYMKVDTSKRTETSGVVKPPVDEQKILNWLDWVKYLRDTYQINCWFYWTNTKLYFYCARNTKDEKYIDLMSPTIKFISEEYSNINVSKVTVLYVESEYSRNTKEYTLFSNGEIIETTSLNPTPQENRVEGEWKYTYTQDEIDVEATARGVLCRAQYGHKITFYATDDFELYDKVQLRTPAGKIVRSFVSGITENKGSKYKLIECGELQTAYPYI